MLNLWNILLIVFIFRWEWKWKGPKSLSSSAGLLNPTGARHRIRSPSVTGIPIWAVKAVRFGGSRSKGEQSIGCLPWSLSSSSSGSEMLSSSSSSAADLGDLGEGGTSGPSASLPEWSASPKEPALPPPLFDRFNTGLWSVGEPENNVHVLIRSRRGNKKLTITPGFN